MTKTVCEEVSLQHVSHAAWAAQQSLLLPLQLHGTLELEGFLDPEGLLHQDPRTSPWWKQLCGPQPGKVLEGSESGVR